MIARVSFYRIVNAKTLEGLRAAGLLRFRMVGGLQVL
jgi:hypothetical protein